MVFKPCTRDPGIQKTKLFEGQSQKTRFGDLIKEVLSEFFDEEILQRFGTTQDNLDTLTLSSYLGDLYCNLIARLSRIVSRAFTALEIDNFSLHRLLRVALLSGSFFNFNGVLLIDLVIMIAAFYCFLSFLMLLFLRLNNAIFSSFPRRSYLSR